MKLWKLGMATLGTGLALSLASVSHAQLQVATQPIAMNLGTNCSTGAAAATIDLGTTPTNNDQTSADGNYTCSGCRRYVVDVKLPANVGGYMFMPNVNFADGTPSGQAACEASQMTVHYFRKAAGATTFSAMGGGTTRGVWTGNTGQFGQNTCNLTGITGFQKPQLGPIAGNDVWRIAVGGVQHSLPVKVKVGAMLQGIPK